MTTENTELTTEQAKELVINLFSEGLGVAGHQNYNGADYYQCCSCCATKPTMGNAASFGYIESVDHSADCELVKLYNWSRN